MKNIITISGNLGSGKSTVGNIISQELCLDVFASGDIMRLLASKKGMNINEFVEFLNNHKEYDKLIDGEVVNIAKDNDNLLFVSRMAWYFIPDSFKVFLYVDEKVGAKRIMNDKIRSAEEYGSFEDAFNSIVTRFNKSRKRFYFMYGVDICEKSNYDLYLDTTDLSINEVKETIIKKYNIFKKEKVYEKSFINHKCKN